ncbi:MAG: trigger factor [Candidatus Brocadiaceae bacterium]|nr:trigger factor [Candidatus Brocadiaceae bacterium]
MNVTIEDAGPCKKVLKFEIPKETIESEFEKKTKEACDTIELPGFRKGRAPRKLVEKRFGPQIKEDVKQAVISDCYQKALEENKMEPAGDPQFGEIKLEVGEPFIFDVTLEVWPTFEVNNYKGINLKRASVVVTDDDVQRALNDMAFRKAQLEVIKNGKVIKGDRIICDCTVEVDNNSVLEDKDIEINVQENTEIVKTKIVDLLKNIEGTKSGHSCTFDAQLSDNFEREEYRGKDAKITLQVNEIKRPVAPEISEEFATSLGFDTLEDLKSNIHKQVESFKKRQSEENLRNQMISTLLEQIKFELPQDLVNAHTEQKTYKHQMDLLKRGMPLDEIEKQKEAIKNASAESVMQELKASLILNRIAEKERIFVTEGEVEQRIADIARAYNTDSAQVRKQLQHQGSLSYLRNEMREDKTLEFLIKEAHIEGQ